MESILDLKEGVKGIFREGSPFERPRVETLAMR